MVSDKKIKKSKYINQFKIKWPLGKSWSCVFDFTKIDSCTQNATTQISKLYVLRFWRKKRWFLVSTFNIFSASMTKICNEPEPLNNRAENNEDEILC